MPAATGTVIITLDNKVTDCELLPGRDETVFSINIPGRGRIDKVKEQTAILRMGRIRQPADEVVHLLPLVQLRARFHRLASQTGPTSTVFSPMRAGVSR